MSDEEKVKLLADAINDTFHAGVSFLRTQNADTLRQLERPCILHSHSEPIAALIPYELFMAVQRAYTDSSFRTSLLGAIGVSLPKEM